MALIFCSEPRRENALTHSSRLSLIDPVQDQADSGHSAAIDAFAQHYRNDASPWVVFFEGYLSAVDSGIHARAGNLDINAALPARLISHLLDEFGTKLFNLISGSFVVVAQHRKSGEIIAARDRCGGRTIYSLVENDRLWLSTRSAWLLRATDRNIEENPEFIVSQFALQTAPPAGHSAFVGVHELGHGEVLRWANGRSRISRHNPEFKYEPSFKPPGASAEHLLDLLRSAVSATLPYDGDVACMLSGGLDSGPVAVLADQLLADTGRDLRSISWSVTAFPEADESEWIQEAASKLRHPVDLEDLSLVPFFSELRQTSDWPARVSQSLSFDSPSYNAFRPLVNNCYARAAQAGCKVVLNANAGDAIYAPRPLVNLDRARRGQWRAIVRDAVRMARYAGLGALLADPAIRHPLGRLVRGRRRTASPPEWLTPEGKKHWQPVEDNYADSAGSNGHPFPSYVDQLLGSSMAFGRAQENAVAQQFGIDRRDPFHNEALLKFMLQLPMDLSWRGGTSKYLMRSATKGLISDSLRLKSRTGRLETLFDQKMRANAQLIQRLLFEEQTSWQRYIIPDVIRTLVAGEKSNYPKALISTCIGHAIWSRYWG